MKRLIFSMAVAAAILTGCGNSGPLPVRGGNSDLQFKALAPSWDEAVPLGNGVVGTLVWQRDSVLRFSLDRTDLWDLRPMDSIAGDNNRFAWVVEQVRKGDYLPVQKKFDHPYDQLAAPAKIPGAALEFTGIPGTVDSVRLYLANALCQANWNNGIQMQTFVHANEPLGWFEFRNLPDSIVPAIIAPKYSEDTSTAGDNAQSGPSLLRLGYPQGDITSTDGLVTYHQPGYDGFAYDVAVRWERDGSTLRGVWSVTSSASDVNAVDVTASALERGINADYADHMKYWNSFYAQSSVSLPDSVLQKQYDNEMYKFGSASRSYSSPISLQAVWTADNGLLPPWKGDYHHDLNTQLSYWPAYTGNHLDEGLGYINTLWNQRDTYKEYTRTYFGTEGMNVPGVCTLDGKPLGGWIQYSMSPTVGAWLGQHFYLHWKYSADSAFLAQRAYPFMKDIATYLEQISAVDDKGVRRLPISSSPEVFDNSINAWFSDMTNFDTALMKFAFNAAGEMADSLSLADEAARWRHDGSQLPALSLDADSALAIAPGFPYKTSHRHFSHSMAIHPLGLIDWSDSDDSRRIITATLDALEKAGPDYWCGYSYSWMGNMRARALDGEGAARALRTFAECFCLPNTFHVNGDQSGAGKSQFTYRPFTLEGNFAFAAGIQEMLLQSHTGVIRVFPAIPSSWHNVAFDNLRAMGAFLVSARKTDGTVSNITVRSEKGGQLRLAIPKGHSVSAVNGAEVNPAAITAAPSLPEANGLLTLPTKPGDTLTITLRAN